MSVLTHWVANALDKIRDQTAVPGSPAQSAVLKGARNEFVPFQIGLKGQSSGIGATASMLTDGHGHSIPAPRLYRCHLIYCPNPSGAAGEGTAGYWPDALIPDYDEFDGQKRNAFPFSTSNANDSRSIWVDLFIPVSAAAGTYTGTVTVQSNGNPDIEVPITLTVWGFTLLPTASLRSYFGLNYGGIPAAHGLFGSDWRYLRKRYAALALDHRISVSGFDDGYNTASNTWNTYGDLIGGSSGMTKLSGAKLTSVKRVVNPDSAAQWATVAKANGFFDRLIDYSIDEPQGGQYSNWSQVTPLATTLHGIDPNYRMLVTTLFAEAQAAGKDGYIDIMATVIDQMYGKPGMTPSGLQRSTYNAWLANKAIREVWLYQSNDSNWNAGYPYYAIDVPALRARQLEWLSFLYSCTGELYYETMDLASNGQDVWTYPWSSYGNNGDGQLFYPGTPGKIGGSSHVPVASIRMKMIRAGMQDYEYLRTCASLGDETYAINQASPIFPNAWTTPSITALETARENLANRILTLSGAPEPPPPGPSGSAPVITSFTATPPSILSGGSATIAWSISNANNVSLNQGIGVVGATSSRLVVPAQTTTYTLTATNTYGQTIAQVTVTVQQLSPTDPPGGGGGGGGGGIPPPLPPSNFPTPLPGDALAPIVSSRRAAPRTISTGPLDLRLDGDDLAYAAGNLEIVSGIEWLRQAIQCNLRLVRGEWFIDPTVGVPYFESILVKGPNLPLIRSVLRKAILGVPYVAAVEQLDLKYDRRARSLTVAFRAKSSLSVEPVEAEIVIVSSAAPASSTAGFDQPSDEEMN